MKDSGNEPRAYLPILPQARCPATGAHFTLSVAADLVELAGQKAIITISVCPACGNEHAWRLDEVVTTA